MTEIVGPEAVEDPRGPSNPPPSAPEPSSTPEAPSVDEMTLVDHLAELRRRIAISVLAVVVFAAVGFIFAEQIITLMVSRLPTGQVVFLTVGGGFFVFLRIALIVGFFLALPIILYQAWAFVAPGLTREERRAALPWIPLSVIFFIIGILVAWFILPFAFEFLLGFQVEDVMTPMTSAEAFFSFVTIMFVIFGLVMQFPIIIVFLDKLGILNVDQLRTMRRYVLFGIVVFAVVATPGGDPYSPIVMSAVMYGLFEFTIFWLGRRQPEATPAADADG